jgi:hypothetical protein
VYCGTVPQQQYTTVLPQIYESGDEVPSITMTLWGVLSLRLYSSMIDRGATELKCYFSCNTFRNVHKNKHPKTPTNKHLNNAKNTHLNNAKQLTNTSII